MKVLIIYIALFLSFSFCYGQHHEQFIEKHSGIHKVIVSEVLQTSSYSYLLVQDGNKKQWLAVPKIEARVGEIYYYQGGNEMKDFKSSQLNRIFESVLFLGGIVNTDPLANEKSASVSTSEKTKKSTNSIEISIEPFEGGTTIAELFSNKSTYASKTIKIKGIVSQFSPSIMDRNWIHLQDGTKYENNFELVATSDMIFEEGTVVILEGEITLDKDFGYGYFYKVIMENAKIIQ